MAYARKLLQASIQLGKGSFGSTGADTITIPGHGSTQQLRISATINKSGGLAMSTANIKILGLTLEQMNQLSQLKQPILSNRANNITLSAGDTATGLSTVFTGGITESWPNMESSPEVCLEIMAMTGVYDSLRPVPPTSYGGPVDVATVIAGIAEIMNYGFINNGVSVILPPSYFPGTARDQALAAAKHAGIQIAFDDGTTPQQGGTSNNPSVPSGSSSPSGNPVIVIWPTGGTRGGLVPLISAETGMLGYPTVTSTGIVVKSLYNSALAIGGSFQCQSSLTIANGTWGIFNLTHELETENVGGNWFSHFEGFNLGQPAPIANA